MSGDFNVRDIVESINYMIDNDFEKKSQIIESR